LSLEILPLLIISTILVIMFVAGVHIGTRLQDRSFVILESVNKEFRERIRVLEESVESLRHENNIINADRDRLEGINNRMQSELERALKHIIELEEKVQSLRDRATNEGVAGR